MKPLWTCLSPVLLAALFGLIDILTLPGILYYPLYLIPVVLIFLLRARPWTLVLVSVLSLASMFLSDHILHQSQSGDGVFLLMLLVFAVFILSLSLMDADRKHLSELKEKWRTLFELLPVGVSVLGPEGKVVEQNATLAKILAMTPEGIAQGAYRARTYLRADGSPLSPEEFASSRVRRGERVVNNVITGIVTEAGETLWSSVSATACDFRDWKTIIVTTDITPLKMAEHRLELLVRQKELILREVHHRIKNNMSTLSGMLLIQSEASENPEVQKALTTAITRIQTMMVLYNKLFITRDFCTVNLREYLPALGSQILSNFPGGSQVDLDLSAENVSVGGDSLMALSIILNELITNTMKYAFQGACGTIRIRLDRREGRNIFHYGDGGRIPLGEVPGGSGGFGLQLIRLMAEQMGGRIEDSPPDSGGFILSFPDGEVFCRD